MSGVYLSYRPVDARWAQRLSTDLGMDVVPLADADVVLVIIGPQWVVAPDGRRWLDDPKDPVRVELMQALKLRVPMLPLLIGTARMPRPGDIPAVLAPVRELPAITMRSRAWETDVARLRERLPELVED